jgi:hypothetical protein
MTFTKYAIYKIIAASVLLLVFFAAFEYQHMWFLTEDFFKYLRGAFLLSALAAIYLLKTKRPFLAYIALAIGFLMGFLRASDLNLSLLIILGVSVVIHRIVLFKIESREA